MKEIPKILKARYKWIKQHSAQEESQGFIVEVIATDRVGLVADISSAISSMKINLSYIQSWIEYDGVSHILLQTEESADKDSLTKSIAKLKSVKEIKIQPLFRKTYGKRVIIMGGGAQVAQVAAGAIAEADRHNIRGETISVDTIARVGELELAQSIRSVGMLHRAAILVLAGALMGGEITKAVTELRGQYGIPVIALKMAGSVVKAVDLVVTDPLQAGVMSVMLISKVGAFNLLELHKKEF